MTAQPFRVTAAGIAALAALTIAGCTPPHENPSTQKVDTATSQNPDSLASSGLAGQTASATNVADASAARKDAAASETVTVVVGEDDTPFVDNCGETGLERPARLNLDCKDNRDRLEDIVWSEWNEMGASGTATRVTTDPDRVVEGAQVTLGEPQDVDGVLTFTVLSVDGTSVNPDSQY